MSTKKVYVDTNIFMDYLMERFPLSFFEDAVQCRFSVYVSDVVFDELKYQKVDSVKLCMWLNFAGKLKRIKITNSIRDRAKGFLQLTHHNDALHAAAAEFAKVDFLLTRNVKDFHRLVKHPDDL